MENRLYKLDKTFDELFDLGQDRKVHHHLRSDQKLLKDFLLHSKLV